MKQLKHLLIPLLLCLILSGCVEPIPEYQTAELDSIPYYSGDPYVVVYDNLPDFPEEAKVAECFEEYGDLDALNRCTVAYACVGIDTMPTEKRGNIGSVKPTGWQVAKYDSVDGKYLYNRCHLIGFQLTAENANERNLITGTRYMNVDGMLPFENLVADYVKETDHHVLYRVTPIFDGDNLVADGVQMEALSVEDGGEAVSFNVFVYNVQPGVTIDYATGESRLAEEDSTSAGTGSAASYILNTNSKKFHDPGCANAASISQGNRQDFTGSRQELLDQGYAPCGQCKP